MQYRDVDEPALVLLFVHLTSAACRKALAVNLNRQNCVFYLEDCWLHRPWAVVQLNLPPFVPQQGAGHGPSEVTRLER